MADETTTPIAETKTPAATGGASLGSSLGLTSDTGAPEPAVARTPDEPKNGWWWGTGRRKTAVARVRIGQWAQQPLGVQMVGVVSLLENNGRGLGVLHKIHPFHPLPTPPP